MSRIIRMPVHAHDRLNKIEQVLKQYSQPKETYDYEIIAKETDSTIAQVKDLIARSLQEPQSLESIRNPEIDNQPFGAHREAAQGGGTRKTGSAL